MSEGELNSKWLFSRNIDLTVFLGSAIVSILLLLIGAQLGILNDESPDWAWIATVLMIDVAHVWSTSFRTYFDFEELKKNLVLYLGVPIAGYLIGVALYSNSALSFWKVLAIIAVFHFVRQQYGWVALYRRKAGESGALGYWIDTIAIYMASIYPLAFWTTNLPRNFEWFIKDDFIALPGILSQILFPVYIASLSAYFIKSLYLFTVRRRFNIGKDIVVATTALCWYLGIVYFNSDYAFTVTNIIIHGVPYFAIIYLYAKRRRETAAPIYKTISSNWLVFLATLWALAYIEELLWNRGIWHEKNWLFGENFELENWKVYVVPLLALPQLIHYVLDGFIWRKGKFKI
jgi:hypothetical protein